VCPAVRRGVGLRGEAARQVGAVSDGGGGEGGGRVGLARDRRRRRVGWARWGVFNYISLTALVIGLWLKYTPSLSCAFFQTLAAALGRSTLGEKQRTNIRRQARHQTSRRGRGASPL